MQIVGIFMILDSAQNEISLIFGAMHYPGRDYIVIPAVCKEIMLRNPRAILKKIYAMSKWTFNHY